MEVREKVHRFLPGSEQTHFTAENAEYAEKSQEEGEL